MTNFINELKQFTEKQIELARKYSKTPNDVYNHRALAYGALLFAQNIHAINDCTWWDDCWYEFQIIIDEINNRKKEYKDNTAWRR